MNRIKRSKQGFTLIELVIVIAILAILAGVAIPVYSGYANKANEAADLQLLGAVNTAFSAACLSHGVDPRNVNASAELDEGYLSLTSDGLENAFLTFYGANVNTPFKVFTTLAYDKANGVFVDGDQTKTVAYGGGSVSATMAQLAAFQNSTFGDITLLTLADDLNKVANALAGTMEDSATFVSSELGPFLESLGLSEAELSDPNVQNAMILYIASTTDQSMDIDSVIEQMTTTGDVPHISNTGNQMADLATDLVFAYSIVESYINSGMATGNQENAFRSFNEQPINKITPTSIRALFQSFLSGNDGTDSNFENYLDSTGKSDIKGYLSALKIMKENSSILSSDNLDELLGEGSFYAALSTLFGN